MKNFVRPLFALALTAACTLTAAQPRFPDSTIKLVVPFAAGGGVDSAARLIARQMQSNLNVTVMVENKPGANGSIGGKSVQAAPADGYTLLFSASTHTLARQVMANPPYDPLTDFAYVARVGEAPLLMVISPQLAPNKLKDVIEAVRQNPSKWAAGLPALGAASHLATLMFAKQGGINLTTAVYKGTAPAVTDVAGGHAQILIDSIISLQAMAKSGKVKPIVVTSATRSAVMPNVPTAAESGFPGFVATSWYGLWAPRNTPADRIQFLNKAVNDAVRQLARSGSFEALGIEPVTESVDEFRKFAAGYVTENADLLRGAGFTPE
ncbi:MAG: tripartite tricarboxylate transporter substrate binding protein [Burkholderiaceae bacterium]|nr:tripartite tricarboxylate transporter substrate binding protein [Burkholderiaceae bacterium]